MQTARNTGEAQLLAALETITAAPDHVVIGTVNDWLPARTDSFGNLILGRLRVDDLAETAVPVYWTLGFERDAIAIGADACRGRGVVLTVSGGQWIALSILGIGDIS